jgi:hypothetical protein
MAITDKQIQDDQAAYEAAFNEDAPARTEQSEDEAFGIAPEAPADNAGAGEGAAAEAAEGEAQPAAGGQADPAAAQAEPETGAETPGEAAGDAADPAAAAEDEPRDDPAVTVTVEADSMSVEDMKKELQRLRSWEGRQRAEEARRGRAADAPAEAKQDPAPGQIDAGGGDAAAGGDAPADAAATETVADVAAQVKAGELTPEQAMVRLTEDFGEDFVNMIQVIARASGGKAAEESVGTKMGELQGAVDDIISHISDADARRHFETIQATHPDFNEVATSQGFKDYVASLPDDKKADAERVAKTGTAKEIVALLDAYKATGKDEAPNADTPAADPVVDESQLDAAEGVRSSGMALPTQPKPAASSYEDAWNEMA